MDDKGELLAPNSEPDPRWMPTLLLLARDKHFDWVPGMLRFWADKLKQYPEPMVEHVLVHCHWTIFPSADEVIAEIELVREDWRHESAERAWLNWKLEQERAGREGLLATEADYQKMREAMKCMVKSKAIARMEAPPAQPAKEAARQPMTDEQFRDRKEMLRQQAARIEAMRKATP